MKPPKTQPLRSGSRARLFALQARMPRPRRVLAKPVKEVDPGGRSMRDVYFIAWLIAGVLVLGGVLPKWQPALLITLILTSPLPIVACLLAMEGGRRLSGLLYLIGLPLAALAGVFFGWGFLSGGR